MKAMKMLFALALIAAFPAQAKLSVFTCEPEWASLLNELADEHGECFHTVMQGCRSLSNSRPEIDGLDDLLMAPEQQLHDVALEREDR